MGKQLHPTQVLIQQFTSGIGLPFQELLKREIIEDILQEIGVKYKSRIYNPIVIVWSFLSQVLDPDHSCQNAVSRIMRLHKGRLQKGKKRPKYTVSPPFKKKKKTRKCPSDRLILWESPKHKPKDISKEDFDSLPKDLVLREVHCYICIPGFRTKEIIVVTTLIDAIEYPSSDILALYDSRWQAEVNLRHIKTTLGMDILSCQTPEMVRKEIYVYLLAYNLLRSIMYDAGDTFDHQPIRLSLQATRQHLNNFSTKWVDKTKGKAKKIYRIMLDKVADSDEKKRVGRVEPRVRKRRPKAYPLMQEPRSVLRAKMKSA